MGGSTHACSYGLQPSQGMLVPPDLSCLLHSWVSLLQLQAGLFGWSSQGLAWGWFVSGDGEAAGCCLLWVLL